MVRWVLETAVFEKESEKLIEEIKKQGHELYLADGRETVWGGKPLPYLGDESKPTVVRGSIEFCNYLLREFCEWYPGTYMTMENYSCTHYYPYFNSRLLNEEYVMLPFGELGRRKDWLYKTLGEADTVFIRPNRGNKIFTGQLVYKENWDKDLTRLGFYDTPQDELCVVARPKKLAYECRFIVVKDRVVCGTRYKNYNDVNQDSIVIPADCELFKETQKIVTESKYQPDIVWSIDMTFDLSKDSPKDGIVVMEVGAFSCCGLYGCPPDIVVREVSKAAEEDWKDIYG